VGMIVLLDTNELHSPYNDVWIAAQTMESGAELLTSDSHFEKIPGLVYTSF
jgi:tRNA(fMet)-specific endonuclease VapC